MAANQARSLFSVAFASILLAGDAPAADAEAQACFAQHPPTQVSSYESDQVAGDGSYTALVGAQLFVPAEKGLTAEWLNYQYSERIAQRRTSADCPLDLAGVSVSVQSAGPGFWVQLSAPDESTAKELLRRSRLWVKGAP